MCCVRIQKMYSNDIEEFQRGLYICLSIMCWILLEPKKKGSSMFGKEKNDGCFSLQMERSFRQNPTYPASKEGRSSRDFPAPKHQNYCISQALRRLQKQTTVSTPLKNDTTSGKKVSLPTADLFIEAFSDVLTPMKNWPLDANTLPIATHVKPMTWA